MDEVSKFCNIPCFNEKVSKNDYERSVICHFYRGKVVFITGATGFLGQLFVEKLLRCGVEHVYVLARAKKNMSAEERTAKVFTGELFCVLNKHDPDYLKRLTVIEGDIAKLNLGISEENLALLYEKVHLIFHVAADVRFQEKLHQLIMVNLRGTREFLRMLENFKNLQMFTYISTAYSNCVRGHNIYEQFYDYPIDPDTAIAMSERINNNENEKDNLEILSDQIIRPWPNTYTYTKCLSEELVRRYGEKYPVIVVRPSVVVSTHMEPIPGWSNNVYGYNGMLFATGLGLMRTTPLRCNIIGDFICADFVINSTLVAIWARHEELSSGMKLEAKIYMIGSSVDNPVNWDCFSRQIMNRFSENPSTKIIWVTTHNPTVNPYLGTYYIVLFHFLPAVFIDLFLKLSGNKLRLLPGTRKIQNFLNSLTFFIQNEWIFDNTNLRQVMNRMSVIDHKVFNCDLRKFDMEAWVDPFITGLRWNIAGEKLHARSNEIGRRRFRYRKIAHCFVVAAYYAFTGALIYGLAKGFGLVDYVNDGVRDWQQFLENPSSDFE